MITFDDYELMRDRVSSIDQVQFDYERATLMGRLATIIETGGLSMAAAVKASGVGFIGSGIGAFSASASFSMASARHEAVSNEAKNEEFAIGQELCYSFPKRIVEVQIENVRLVDGALSKIKEMYQQILAIGGDGTGNGAKADAIKPLVEKFLLEYGSHVYLSATLGGVLIRQAEMQVKDVTHLYDYKQALSNQLQSSASLSGAYFGQSGFGSMGGGGAGRSNQDSSTGNVANSQQHSASTYLRTKLIGGQDTKDSLDLWKLSLGFSSNLNVIDRKKVKAVWEIIQARHGKRVRLESNSSCFFLKKITLFFINRI